MDTDAAWKERAGDGDGSSAIDPTQDLREVRRGFEEWFQRRLDEVRWYRKLNEWIGPVGGCVLFIIGISASGGDFLRALVTSGAACGWVVFTRRNLGGMVDQWNEELRSERYHAACYSCGGYLPSTLDWVCPHCGATNGGNNHHSYLNQCGHCSFNVHALRCPHCKVKLRLTDVDTPLVACSPDDAQNLVDLASRPIAAFMNRGRDGGAAA